MTSPLVAVVGAGVTGLAAAWRLHREGARVVVLEQGRRTGGVLHRQHVPGGPPGLVVDVGAEAMLARRPEAVRLAEEVGLGPDLVEPATTRAAIWSRGRLHPVPAGTVMGVPGDPDALRGLLTEDEVAAVAAERGRSFPLVEGDVDVATWVSRRVGPAVVDRLVEPLLGGVYAGHAHRLSLRATLPAAWDAAASGASVVDITAARAAAGTAAGGAVFAGIRGGVARLAERLTAVLADAGTVRTGACVHAVEAGAGRRFRLRVGARPIAEVLDVDGVVLAVPPRRAARLLQGPAPAAAAELASVSTASTALVTAVLPGGVLDTLADGRPLSGVLVPPVEGRLVKAMTFSSVKWAWVRDAAGGRDVVRLSVGREGEEQVLQRPDEDLAAAALADASRLLGRPLTPSAALVTRWGGALPQYGVGHVDAVTRVRHAVGEVRGLAVAGAAYEGLGVPACIATADAAARQVLDAVR